MIKVRSKTLFIPAEEQSIGAVGEADSTVREFHIDRVSGDGVDLANLLFKLNIRYAGVREIDRSDLEKIVTDNAIILRWLISSVTLRNAGTAFLQLDAFDETGSCRWKSYPGAVYIEKSLGNAEVPSNTLSELEQLEKKFAKVGEGETARVEAEKKRVIAEEKREEAEGKRNTSLASIVAEEEKIKAVSAETKGYKDSVKADKDAIAADKQAITAIKNETISARDTAHQHASAAEASKNNTITEGAKIKEAVIALKNEANTAKNEANTAKTDAVNAKNEAVSAMDFVYTTKNEMLAARNEASTIKAEVRALKNETETARQQAEGYKTEASTSAQKAKESETKTLEALKKAEGMGGNIKKYKDLAEHFEYPYDPGGALYRIKNEFLKNDWYGEINIGDYIEIGQMKFFVAGIDCQFYVDDDNVIRTDFKHVDFVCLNTECYFYNVPDEKFKSYENTNVQGSFCNMNDILQKFVVPNLSETFPANILDNISPKYIGRNAIAEREYHKIWIPTEEELVGTDFLGLNRETMTYVHQRQYPLFIQRPSLCVDKHGYVTANTKGNYMSIIRYGVAEKMEYTNSERSRLQIPIGFRVQSEK